MFLFATPRFFSGLPINMCIQDKYFIDCSDIADVFVDYFSQDISDIHSSVPNCIFMRYNNVKKSMKRLKSHFTMGMVILFLVFKLTIFIMFSVFLFVLGQTFRNMHKY